jgi:tetratricopeptide (TPR) repeat protein
MPAALLALAEIGLRLAGYGFDTAYFLPRQINGANYFVPNDRFGYQFFPPALARTPLPVRMAAQKTPGTFRIFLFGESAAEGDPDPTFGMGRYLETLLRARYPAARCEVVCVAMTAIDSHVILQIARECAQHDGDLWIIYMGNNEMIGPFGASTVFGPQAPPLWLTRTSMALRRLRLGQWLSRLTSQAHGPASWAGMKMFEQNKLGRNDPRRLRAYDNFRANVRDMLTVARHAGIPALVCGVASNLRDNAPFLSEHRPGLSEADRRQWEQCLAQGMQAEASPNAGGAASLYAQAEQLDPDFAELHYHIGIREFAAGDSTNALAELTEARDTDALVFRSDTRINATLREEAAAFAPGARFVDVPAALARLSPQGIVGHELFYEHVHLNFAGNYAAAQTLADETAPLLPAAARAGETNRWLTAEEADDALAVSVWDRFRVWQENYSRVSEPPFTGQLNAAARARFYRETLQSLQAQMTPADRAAGLAHYTASLQRAPDDWFLHGNFAQFLEYTGDLPGALAERQRVQQLLPFAPAPLYEIGRLQMLLDHKAEAKSALSEALQLQPEFIHARLALGEIAANEQQNDEALKHFTRALHDNPGSVEALIDLGFLAQNEGHLDLAQQRYAAAAAIQPTGPPAHFFQAIAASLEHRTDEALKHFRDAVWMNPQFWQAHYLYGQELAAAHRPAEARDQFAAAQKIRPDFSPARAASNQLSASNP